ncbi:MAG: hypothetical protein HDR94_01830 [Bacteroides sp.]|nr:hypothetical protein [Bacteroides sp.]
MSEQEKIALRTKINKGLRDGYFKMLKHKAALGLDVIVADSNGKPIAVPAATLLLKDS